MKIGGGRVIDGSGLRRLAFPAALVDFVPEAGSSWRGSDMMICCQEKAGYTVRQ